MEAAELVHPQSRLLTTNRKDYWFLNYLHKNSEYNSFETNAGKQE